MYEYETKDCAWSWTFQINLVIFVSSFEAWRVFITISYINYDDSKCLIRLNWTQRKRNKQTNTKKKGEKHLWINMSSTRPINNNLGAHMNLLQGLLLIFNHSVSLPNFCFGFEEILRRYRSGQWHEFLRRKQSYVFFFSWTQDIGTTFRTWQYRYMYNANIYCVT